ncbi:HEPN domain-containing protein [Candidatus Collierbacteria bacterium]|nr:HEPN domain-containing protein [Candidatus Collierbacteria bacterium]
MTDEELIQYWKKSAEDALSTAQELNKPGKYHHSLFFLHLAIEKILKAAYVKKRGETPPPIHDLVRLAEGAGLPMVQDYTKKLVEISSFNISARYDDYKQQFYKKANAEYAQKWLDIGKNILEEVERSL